MRCRWVLPLLGVLAIVRAAPAQEAVPTVPVYADPSRKAPRLSYQRGPAECLTESDFRREVGIALDGVDLFDETAPDVLRVWFEKIPGGFRGTIEYTDANGGKESPKVQTDPHCPMLARWVAESTVPYFPRRLRSKAAASPAAPTSPPLPCSDPVPSQPVFWVPPVLPPPRFQHPPPRSRRKMDVTIGLSGLALMTVGLTANVGPAFGIMADVRYEWFSLGLELRGVIPSTTYASEEIPGTQRNIDRVDFDLSQWTALLVPCGRWKYLVGCAVAQGGSFVVATPVQTNSRAVLSFGPRLGFEVPFAERFAVFGFGEALFAAVNAGVIFDVAEPGGVAPNVQWVQSIVSGFFGAGLSVKFQ